MDPHTIRSFREAKGLSQSEFASLIGVTPTAVTQWEKGQAPSGPALKLLEWLINGTYPFGTGSDSPFDWNVNLSLTEWEELERRRIKQGYGSVKAYMVSLIRQDRAAQAPTLEVSPKPSEKKAARAGKARKRAKS